MKKVKILPFLISLPFIVLASGCNGDTKVSPSHQRHFHDEDEVNSLRDVAKYGEKMAGSAPTTGNTRVFVVPVEFRDYPADEIGKYYNSDTDKRGGKTYAKRYTDSTAEGRGREAARQDIYNVYFGAAEDTQWHSLRSYYEASSYGALHFEGLVADWFRPYSDWERPDTWASAAEWASGDGAANALATQLIDLYSDETEKKYLEFKDEQGNPMFKSGTEFLQYFDTDHDGCFDLIEIVYSAPFHATDAANENYNTPINNDIFWAYCGGHRTGNENLNRPTISKYAFFSYYTFVEAGKLEEWGQEERRVSWTTNEISDGTAKMDAHTLIHETGHALGLPDYYDTSYSGKNASGSVDMMDYNVGDHNSYSKTQLEWVDPIVVTGPTLVTVRSFTETGDCIMVPYRGFYKDHPEYGNSSNIEYMAIELYTPTGVNKMDSEHQYAGSYPKCPSISGIKIYHVDSRLGVFNYNGGWKFQGFTEKIIGTGDLGQVAVASSNSNDNHVEDFWQLQYLSRDEAATVTLVTNESLFQAGDTFNTDESYANFKMNECYKDNEEEHIPFGYKITIQECSANSATILFEAC